MLKSYTKAPKLYIKGGLGSMSAKRVAAALSEKKGYKVFRSLKTLPKRVALKYGQGVSKLDQFAWFQDHGIPALEYTEDHKQALQWVDEGYTVFGRLLLNASCGKGIVVYNPGDVVDETPKVFTKYKKKKREFRVHVFKDTVVRVVEKKLRSNWNGPRDSKIRNLANGFVFCSCTDEPEGIRALAVRASKVVQSDFKGVDIGYNEKLGELFVVEVNSAPGIEGSNVEAYVNAILG